MSEEYEIEESPSTESRQVVLMDDEPVPGQNYVCLSFVSPENEIRNKNLYLVRLFVKDYLTKLFERKESVLNVSDSDVRAKMVKERMDKFEKLCTEDFKPDYKSLEDDFELFKIEHEDAINKDFNLENNFRTNVRGLKVRGVYDIKEKAEARVKQLIEKDDNFNIYIGQVGTWLPWDPNPNDIEDQSYLRDDLNNLVQMRKTNRENVDKEYESRKKESIEKARKKADEFRKEHNLEQPEDTYNKLEEMRSVLNEKDPWLQRKEQEQEQELPKIEEVEEVEPVTKDDMNDIITNIF